MQRRGEANVFRSDELGPLIREFSRKWLINHPSPGVSGWHERRNSAPPREVIPMGPIDWISWQSGVSTRQISRFTNEHVEYVPESVGEKILIAIGMHYKMATGEIQVIRNPNWSQEQWQEYMHSQGCD